MYSELLLEPLDGDSAHLLFLPDEMDEMESESDEEYRCGIWVFKPDWLQKLKKTVWALLAISFAALLQGAVVNGILHLMLSTIERRFNLRSFNSGLVSGSYDIASLICLIPVTYFGGRPQASKPRWIGGGIIVVGIGSLIFALPHFIKKIPFYSESDSLKSNLCNEHNANHEVCKEESKLSDFMWIFVIGNLLHGAGASPLFTLGVSFIDENVEKRKSALYMGVYYTAATLGVALGYVAGGYFLQLNEDFWPHSGHKLVYSITPDNKNWIGAWWLGFVINGVLCLVVAIPILSVPARLPDWTKAKLSRRLSEAAVGIERTEAYSKLRELPSAMLELFRNTSFILLNFAGCCEGLIFSGSGAFIPKIIQIQFHLSYKTTALIMGIITVPSAIIGTLVGGGLLRKFDLGFVGVLKLCIGTTSLSLVCASCFLIYCADEKMVGLNLPYYSDRKEIILGDPCNAKCGCFGWEFKPICGVNNYTYYSPCYAGCQNAHSSSIPDVTIYTDCSCIDGKWDDGTQATSQSCTAPCKLLPIFLILMYLSLFFTFMNCMPALTATLRCVKDDQRSLALGLQWVLVRLLGMVPGPMLFGFILDGTCKHWQAPACSEEEGSCILYDHYMISWSMVLLAYSWKFLEIILFILAIYFYKKDKEQHVAVVHSLLPSDSN